MASWSQVVDFSDAFTTSGNDDNDRPITFRVMGDLAMVVFDPKAGKRRVIPMRWGYPRRGNWRSPDPIHARSETIESKRPSQRPFRKASAA